MTKKEIKFIFFALSPTGAGLSGGDRIFIELARIWSNEYKINIFTTLEGIKMCANQNLKGRNLKVIQIETNPLPISFVFKYLTKIFLGIKLGLSLVVDSDKKTYIYSASDFWMDVIPSVLLKIRYPKLKWIATWYQTAPSPLVGYSEKQGERARYRFSALLYWLSQLPVKPLINYFADFVLVNNDDERCRFERLDKEGKALVLLGAVKTDEIKKYINENIKLVKNKKYDAVFQGRFHPQKGVVELVDIWKSVVQKIPSAKLVMIGDGPLMSPVRDRMKDLDLQKNIDLLGYVFDGAKKYNIFSQSKIVVHPSLYDSGGMASAEAMAFGIPGVSYDLKAYESYYPKGMVKVKDSDEFVKVLIDLLKNDSKRDIIGRVAQRYIFESFSWSSRATELIESLLK